MKPDNVAKLPGLFRRADGGAWQIRVVIPLDLQQAYGGKTKLIRSLKTADRREAELLAGPERTRVLAEFRDKRREMNPKPVAIIGPELGATLAANIRATMLRLDDERRSGTARAFSDFLDWSASLARPRITIRPPAGTKDPAPFYGLTPTQLQALAKLHAAAEGAAAVALAARNLGAVVPLADLEARRLGLLIDWRAPEARPVLQECLRAYRTTWRDTTQRDIGQDIQTPQEAPKAAPVAPMTLRQVFERWKAVKPRKEDSVRACERALALFEDRTGNTPVQSITRAQGDDFRSWLQTLGTSSKTAHDRITWVKSLLTYAKRDLDLIQKQPWEGIDITHRTENARRPWSPEEMEALFSSPLFSSYELPKGPKPGRDAAYWVPLLGLYTGARVGELCQLRVVDVERTAAGLFLRITDEAEGATVKTAAGHRRVPVHPELVRLGFSDYLEDTRQANPAGPL